MAPSSDVRRAGIREAHDQQEGHRLVVILSHELWVERFGADPYILGRVLRLSGFNVTVIGVLPPGFEPLLKGRDSATNVVPAALHGARSIGWANVQQLGARILDGLEVLGTRTTVESTLSGNKQPISVSERWFAPDLNVTVMMTDTHARGSDIVYKL